MGFFSRKQDQSLLSEPPARRSKARRSEARGEEPEDPLDPVVLQKKRARRRLVGAVTLALAAVVFLPMVFDSEPQPVSDDLSVQLPAKSSPFTPKQPVAPSMPPSTSKPAVSGVYSTPAAAPGGGDNATNGVAAPSGNATPGSTSPAPGTAPAAATTSAAPVNVPAPASGSGNASSNSVPSASAPAAKSDGAAAKSATKPASAPATTNAGTPASGAAAPAARETVKDSAKDAGKDSAKDAAKADALRAQAILDGRADKSVPAPAARKGPGGPFAVQIGAFENREKVDELVSKLGAAGMKTYTEKLQTPQGERTRVRLGPFATRDEAQKALERAKGMNLDGSLVTP